MLLHGRAQSDFLVLQSSIAGEGSPQKKIILKSASLLRCTEEKQLFFFEGGGGFSLIPFGSASSCVRHVCLRDPASSSSSGKMLESRRSQTVLIQHTPGGVCTCAFPLRLHRAPQASGCICQLYIPGLFTSSSASLSVQTHSSSRARLSLFLLSGPFFLLFFLPHIRHCASLFLYFKGF